MLLNGYEPQGGPFVARNTSGGISNAKQDCCAGVPLLPGAPMLNDRTTPLSLLQTRRSGRPRDMVEPGPTADELATMLAVAARSPDHGKLHPWRFVHVARDRRPALAELLHRAFRETDPEPSRLDLEAVDRLAHQAPELVVVLFSPKPSAKIPLWEQQLSCGAACMNLEHAAHAMGYAAGWITGWAAYSDAVRDAFGQEPERIAGFIYIGTPAMPLEERIRPAAGEIVSRW
jgi:nitroreductase